MVWSTLRTLGREVQNWASYSLPHRPATRNQHGFKVCMWVCVNFPSCLLPRVPFQCILLWAAATPPDVFVCFTTFPPNKPLLGDRTEEQEGLNVAHYGSEDNRRPGLFVLVSWPAVSCLVWGVSLGLFFFLRLVQSGGRRTPSWGHPGPGLSAVFCHCCYWGS